MRQSFVIMSLFTVLMCLVVAGCFFGAVVVIDGQVQTNRANGSITRALVCEVVAHDHLSTRGCR